MTGVAGDGQKDGILGERFRKVGFGAWRGRSVSGDAAHAEGGADGGEHGRSEVPEELDEALAVFRGHGWGLLSVWGQTSGSCRFSLDNGLLVGFGHEVGRERDVAGDGEDAAGAGVAVVPLVEAVARGGSGGDGHFGAVVVVAGSAHAAHLLVVHLEHHSEAAADVAVAGVDALDELAVAVVAGDVDGGGGQLLADVGAGGEDDAARADELGAHLVDRGYGGGADAESDVAQSGDGHAVSLGGPCTHHVADGGPGGVERTLGDAAADAGLVDDLAGGERAVGFGHHHIGPLLFVLLERYVAFGCFYIDSHSV